MTKGKHKQILYELFGNKQTLMAKGLGLSQGKIGHVVNGRQTLSPEAIGLLLTKYFVDPDWYFNSDDDSEVILVGNTSHEISVVKSNKSDQTYIEALEKSLNAMEKATVLQADLCDRQTEEIARLKKYRSFLEHKA
jgi:plasmid maintenance system antidote protein VapI